MTDSGETEVTRSPLSLRALAKYIFRAWLMSFRSDEIVTVRFITNSGSQITFAEFLRGRKLP